MIGVNQNISEESYPIRTKSSEILENTAEEKRNQLSALNKFTDNKRYVATDGTVNDKLSDSIRQTIIQSNSYTETKQYHETEDNDGGDHRELIIGLNKYDDNTPYQIADDDATKSATRESNLLLNKYTETKRYQAQENESIVEDEPIREVLINKNPYTEINQYTPMSGKAMPQGMEEPLLRLNKWNEKNNYLSNQPE